MSPIENMPAEIKHTILLSMPDLPSLAGLVHASPFYHAAYARKRDTILPTITIRELQRRGLCFFEPGILLEVWFRKSKHEEDTGHVKAELLRIFDYCYREALVNAMLPKLSVEQSIFLLGMKTAMLYWAIGGPGIEGIIDRKIVNSRETSLPDRTVLDLDCFHSMITLGHPIYVTDSSMPGKKRKVWLNWSDAS